MNENPYAPPAEIAENAREEEKFENGLRWLAWGTVWLLGGCVSMVIILLYMMLEIYGFSVFWALPRHRLPSPAEIRLVEFIWKLLAAAGGTTLVTFLLGLFCCGFCPNRLVKWGAFHLAGSVGMLVAAVVVPFFIVLEYHYLDSDTEIMLASLFVAGVGASVLMWLFFWLRLANALESVTGERLAWSVMIIFCVLVMGMVVSFYAADLWWEFWWGIRRGMQMLGVFAGMVCVGVYAALLNTLRRRIRRALTGVCSF